MGLITYESLEDGTPITANIFNERFGQIVAELNGKLDQLNFAAGGIPAAALAPGVFEKIYPIGSLYFNSVDNTNPSELLGFGTWTAFAAGQVPVGYKSDDTDFNAAEKTGGVKEVTLTTDQIPAHNHAVDPPSATTSSNGAHTHQTHADFGVNGSGNTATGGAGDPRGNNTTSNGAHTHTVNIPSFNSGNRGGGQAHTNLQPFITVYIWKRTA